MSDLSALLERGVLPARRVAEALGISPATLMRRVREEGDDLLRIGRGRATRYGVRREWSGLATTRFPLVRIDEAGTPVPAGQLVTLAGRQSVWLPDGVVVDGLPVEIADARPSGFLGRSFAAQHPDLLLPPRVTDWSDHHILIALARRGEDGPGNLLIGDESLQRLLARRPSAVSRDAYPALAEAATAGHPPGSSAGGDRPKFATGVDGRQVIVKFVVKGATGDVAAQRWCDLLAIEALALEVLHAGGIPAARALLIDTPTHRFLEVERFDRVGERGRRAAMSLAAVHQDPADAWARAAVRLQGAGLIPRADADRLRWLDAFGALIANVDRHHHNVVFFPRFPERVAGMASLARSYRLAPAFDQLPMLHAPTADGQVPERVFTRPHPGADTLDVWDSARVTATTLWQRASDDPRVSEGMRRIATANARLLSGRG